jgi:hypothetical protein
MACAVPVSSPEACSLTDEGPKSDSQFCAGRQPDGDIGGVERRSGKAVYADAAGQCERKAGWSGGATAPNRKFQRSSSARPAAFSMTIWRCISSENRR